MPAQSIYWHTNVRYWPNGFETHLGHARSTFSSFRRISWIVHVSPMLSSHFVALFTKVIWFCFGHCLKIFHSINILTGTLQCYMNVSEILPSRFNIASYSNVSSAAIFGCCAVLECTISCDILQTVHTLFSRCTCYMYIWC